jgi:hypothetical protein
MSSQPPVKVGSARAPACSISRRRGINWGIVWPNPLVSLKSSSDGRGRVCSPKEK